MEIAQRAPPLVMVLFAGVSKFRSRAFVGVLKNLGLLGLMERVTSAAENAAFELCHSLLQKNVLNTRRWETREELRLAIITWIDKKYHRQRRKRRLGKMTLVEFRALDKATRTA
jgi:putative transposase